MGVLLNISSTSLQEGDTLTITCSSRFVPFGNLILLRHNGTFRLDERLSVSQRTSETTYIRIFVIDPVIVSDSGVYECGEDRTLSRSVNVTVAAATIGIPLHCGIMIIYSH